MLYVTLNELSITVVDVFVYSMHEWQSSSLQWLTPLS